jgi:REP element-mobilizing transposase RayT
MLERTLVSKKTVAKKRLTTNLCGISIRALMARKARAEVEGGLYHVITRGNNRRQIFNSPADYEKFLSLLAVQNAKPSFFLYAYCIKTNHVHLLLELPGQVRWANHASALDWLCSIL